VKFKEIVLLLFLAAGLSPWVSAHHVLGRPAYSLNEDSNTPPSMAVETQIGNFFVTYMVFPAFPRAGEPGRVNLYATRIDNGNVFEGEVSFFVRDDDWLNSLVGTTEEQLGTQLIDDGVYRQGEKPSIDVDACVGCALCREVCIVAPKAFKLPAVS
jgi:NAD-dependent dihydropyrimidine dehydrogenase PreA subunit